MNRTRRRVAIVAGTHWQALAYARGHGIPEHEILWPESALVLVRNPELEVVLAPSFAAHREFAAIADLIAARFPRPAPIVPGRVTAKLEPPKGTATHA